MPLTRQQEEEFDNHLEQIALTTGRTIACPVCGMTPLSFAGVVESGPKAAPIAQAVCKSCGHILFFDCRLSGITI